jgi:hypothetical protein
MTVRLSSLSNLRCVHRSPPTSRCIAVAAHAARASRAVGRKAKLEESSNG